MQQLAISRPAGIIALVLSSILLALPAQAQLKNVVTVSPANGQFTDPVKAVASITDASATNPYLVKIGPGIYPLPSPLLMKSYIDVEGSGVNTTKLTGSFSGAAAYDSALVIGANNSEIRNLALEHSGADQTAVGLMNFRTGTNARNLKIIVSGKNTSANQSYGIYNHEGSSRVHNVVIEVSGYSSTGMFNDSHSGEFFGLDIYAQSSANAAGSASGIHLIHTALIIGDSRIIATGGLNQYGIINHSSKPNLMNLVVVASGSGNQPSAYGLYISGSSSEISVIHLRDSEIDGSTAAIYGDQDSMGTITRSTLRSTWSGPAKFNCIYSDNGSKVIDANCH